MKKLLTAVLVLAMASAWAQSFEGTIKWSMKMEITDLKMKAQMEESKKKMNDPAQQAKMKQMQDQMNDPKMKAMMDANPAMKAQMENAMKMQQGGGGDMMSNMMPKGFTVKVKGGNSLVTMDGGMMSGDILNTPDKSVRLDRTNKTYSVIPTGESKGMENQQKPTVTKTPETMKIVGYNCTKYIVTIVEHGQTITTNQWVTTDIKDFDMKAIARQQKMGRGQSMFYEGVDGVPLRTETQTPQGVMTMEAIEIKRESLNAADFTIPADYKETQGMFGGPR